MAIVEKEKVNVTEGAVSIKRITNKIDKEPRKETK